MKVSVSPVRSKLSGDVPVRIVDDATSCFKTGYQYSSAYRTKRNDGSRVWDGRMHLYMPTRQTLPTGVVPLAVAAVEAAGGHVEVERSVNAEPLPFNAATLSTPLDGLTPRDYQVDAVLAVLHGNPYIGQCGVIRVPTGGGKTLIAAMICRALRPHRALILVHGKQLVDQTHTEITRFLGEEVGMLMADDTRDGRVTVASVDTVASRLFRRDPDVLDLVRSVDIVIADEAHRVGGGKATFQKVMDTCGARVRIGMSGTPFRRELDVDLMLMSRTGPLLYDLTPTRLQAAGHLCEADLQVYEIAEPEMDWLSWREAMDECVFDNQPRTDFVTMVAAEQVAEGKTVLLIAGNSVRYVQSLGATWEKLAGEMPDLGSATFITGKSGREKINQAVDDLREGRIQLLCNTVLFDEGTNIPDLDVVILASPTKSFVKIMQRIGRGLRPKAGRRLLVIDFNDKTNPYLAKHFRHRLSVYKQEGIFETTAISPVVLDA